VPRGPFPDSPRPVGSRTGAVRRRSGLSVAPRFLWECLSKQAKAATRTCCPVCGQGQMVIIGKFEPVRCDGLEGEVVVVEAADTS
jgi:hypothetical protein